MAQVFEHWGIDMELCTPAPKGMLRVVEYTLNTGIEKLIRECESTVEAIGLANARNRRRPSSFTVYLVNDHTGLSVHGFGHLLSPSKPRSDTELVHD